MVRLLALSVINITLKKDSGVVPVILGIPGEGFVLGLGVLVEPG